MTVKWSYLNFFRNSGWSFPPIEVIASTRNHSKIRCDMVWRYPPDFLGHAAFKQGQAATVTSILLANPFEAEILRSALRAGHKIKEDSDEISLPILVCWNVGWFHWFSDWCFYSSFRYWNGTRHSNMFSKMVHDPDASRCLASTQLFVPSLVRHFFFDRLYESTTFACCRGRIFWTRCHW